MKTKNRIFAALISIMMLVGLVPQAVMADDGGITITFSAQKDGAFLFTRNEIEITDGLAEEYGYTVSEKDHNKVAVEDATVFDALVAVHKLKYGDKFTKDTAKNYLDISSSGMLTKAFSESATTTSFFVNGTMPNDGIVGQYGTTGYMADTARLKKGDNVELWFYQDDYWSDYYTYFTETKVEADENEKFTLELDGFMAMSAMGYEPKPAPINGGDDGYITLNTVNKDGSLSEALKGADGKEITIDSKGKATMSFSKAGTYIVTASGMEGSMGAPIVAPWCEVTVVVNNTPRFNNIQFMSSAIKDYSSVYKFNPKVTEYNLEFKNATTTKLTLMTSTTYDTEKYTAEAEYVNSDGEDTRVAINNKKLMYLDKIPFGKTAIKIIISDKEDPDNQTVYTYNITRPRGTGKTIKNKTGVELVPDARALLATKYLNNAEGTMFVADSNGNPTTGTGITGTNYNYRTYLLNGTQKFSLKLLGNSGYEHLRYSIDDGKSWLEPINGETEKIGFSDGAAKVTIEVLDDKTYTENIAAGKDGFADAEPNVYNVWVEQVSLNNASAQITEASVDNGDWYPAFDQSKDSFIIVVFENNTKSVVTFKTADGAEVKAGSDVLQAGENGEYTIELDAGKSNTSKQTLTVTSADGAISNSYIFSVQKRKAGYPDKVIDHLCINSQYTNGIGFGKGASPWLSLNGSITSIGNFGGYITYYYEDAIKDNPNNKYGMDFYVYGNANKDVSTPTKTSFFEPAQCWVSEDGKVWYALAGSAHYDDGVDWNYTVTYEKAANGKTAWSDNHGNTNDGTSYTGVYPLAAKYFLNNLAESDKITLSGIALPARDGNIAVSGKAVDAYPVKWGYADCFPNGKIGADVNPYTDNSNFDVLANGFDLEWAVDEKGNPVDVSDKEFHYVKLQTVSNIWHVPFGEKSPEIAGMVKTTAQNEAVGVTNAPAGVTITDGISTKTINFSENQQVYSANLEDMKYVKVSVNGAAEDDNIYVNNQRIAADGTADGIKITKESGEKAVRVLVQNGDKEPRIYVLRLSSTASESNDLIEGIKLNIEGSARTVETTDGKVYKESVGYRIRSVEIMPISDPETIIKINGEDVKDSYTLQDGENEFTISAEKDGVASEVTLKITKAAAPSHSGDTRIRVYFTLMGDDVHGSDGEVHTLKAGNLTTWIAKTSYELEYPAAVIDVIEKALDGKYTIINGGGNYISQIDDLAEFTNGINSGWMYTLNGKHPNKGVAEQTLSNGDSIVLHYTDDYTQEQGSEEWNNDDRGGSSSTASKYTVTFKTDSKTVFETQKVKKNSLAAKPEDPKKDGYKFVGWYSDEELTKAYDFSQKVTKNITIFAKWEKEEVTNTFPFDDVKTGDWFYEAVKYAYANGIFEGVSENTFAPKNNVTRAMFVTIMYRLDKGTAKNTESIFDDVQDGTWYKDAVLWGYKNGIVNGVSEKSFAPDRVITREEMASMLYRYAKYKGYDVSVGEDTNILSYEDFDKISEYAIEAIEYTAGAGIMTGKTESTINPKDAATRAEAAAMIIRFAENNK